MKKIAIALFILVALHFITRYSLGFSIYRIGDALQVSASLGAKIACSGHYLSGFSHEQVINDLASYSPATNLLDISYDDMEQRVTADMLGIASYSATFREGLGCTLDIGNTEPLNQLFVPQLVQTNIGKHSAELNELESDRKWPAGSVVNSIDGTYQTLTEELLSLDNVNGKQTRALLVIKDGNIVAESYADGISENTQLLGWSMGKSLTAMMLGRMEYLNIADMEERTEFKSWQSDTRKEIAIKQLMQMTSGLQFDETYAPGSDSTRMLFTEHSASDVALEASAGDAPGTFFSYSSGTTNILMRWMQIKLGGNQDLITFFQDEILAPAGMSNTTFEVDPSGVFVGSSYIFASARDWGRLGLIMLNNGKINDQQLLSEKWVGAARTPNRSENYRKYGYQFWLNSDDVDSRWSSIPEDAYMMMGNRKQIVMIIPSEELVIVRLGWTSGSYPTETNFARIINL